MTKSKNTDVAILDESEKPSYLTEMEGQGPINSKDNFDSSDVGVPRVKLLQGTSPEMDAFDNAKPGLFWHTGLDVPLGSSFKFIACVRNKKLLLQAPMEDQQGILARADDAVTWDKTGKWEVKGDKLLGMKTPVTWEITDLDVEKSGLAKWGTSIPDDPDSPPAATLFYDYLIILPEYMEFGPTAMSLARSQISPAKKELNSKIGLHLQNGRPMEAIVFEAEARKDTSQDGKDFYNWSFRSGGFAAEHLFKQAQSVSKAMESFTVRDEGSVDEDTAQPKADSKDF